MLAWVATACFAQTPVTGSTAIPEPSASARELFAKHKDRLVQVHLLSGSHHPQWLLAKPKDMGGVMQSVPELKAQVDALRSKADPGGEFAYDPEEGR